MRKENNPLADESNGRSMASCRAEKEEKHLNYSEKMIRRDREYVVVNKKKFKKLLKASNRGSGWQCARGMVGGNINTMEIVTNNEEEKTIS